MMTTADGSSDRPGNTSSIFRNSREMPQLRRPLFTVLKTKAILTLRLRRTESSPRVGYLKKRDWTKPLSSSTLTLRITRVDDALEENPQPGGYFAAVAAGDR